MRWSLVLGIVVLCAPALRAAVIIASDNEADPAYATGWGPGTNGGSGWGGAWSFANQSNVAITATSANRGWFTGDSRGNDNTAGDTNNDFDINTPSSAVGKAWALYSNTTDHIYAVRPLASPLAVGQTISFDMDNGNIASTQVVGVRLLSSASDIGTRVFEFRFVGGDPDYTLIGSPNVTTTLPFTREAIHVDYTLTGTNTFSLKATRLVDGSVFTTTGTNANANSINAIAFKNQLAGTGATADAYFNNLTVTDVPEPALTGLILGLPMLLIGRTRRV